MRAAGLVFAGCAGVWLAWGSAAVAWAPDKSDSAPASSSGASTSKELEILSKLAGKWKIDEVYPGTPDMPKGAQGKGDAALRVLGENQVVGDYASKCKDMGSDVDALAVYAYDQAAGTYRHWWFDNYGSNYEFLGKYNPKTNSLVFTREYKPSDAAEKLADRYTYLFKDEDTIVFTMEFGTGPGAYDLRLTTTYSRKGKKPAATEEELAPTSPPTKANRAMGR